MKPVIEVDLLCYQHPANEDAETSALTDISFAVNRGEFVAIIGSNGSGKTTLARHLNALLLPTSGTVRINGMDTSDLSKHGMIRSQVGMVFQHPEDQIVATIVEDDIAFGPENLCRLPAEIRRQVDQTLEQLDISAFRLHQPYRLSDGQIQRVALAGVLAMQPEIILFDEATAMLDPRGKQDVMAAMQAIHQQGCSVLFITHNMTEASQAERILLIDKGRLAFDGKPGELFSDSKLVENYRLEKPFALQVRNAFSDWFPKSWALRDGLDSLLGHIPLFPGNTHVEVHSWTIPEVHEKLVSVEGLSFSYQPHSAGTLLALEDIHLTQTTGSVLGLMGATGSGKSTLMQHINGLYLPQNGHVQVGPYNLNKPNLDLKGLRQYAGIVFQNPENYFFNQYVGDEIAYGPRMFNGRSGLREKVQTAMGLVGLDFERFKDRMLSTLSGGEKRKVALAAALAVQPKLLMLDEPTAGLDPQSRIQLLANLKKLTAEGLNLMVSSHRMDDVAALADAGLILSHGKKVSNSSVAEIFADREALLQVGLDQPDAVRMAIALRTQGWPVSVQAITLGQILDEIGSLRGTG